MNLALRVGLVILAICLMIFVPWLAIVYLLFGFLFSVAVMTQWGKHRSLGNKILSVLFITTLWLPGMLGIVKVPKILKGKKASS